MMSIRASSSFLCFLSCSLLSLLLLPSSLHAQQTYVDNTQFDCPVNHSNTLGFLCNGQRTACGSYFIFRSNSDVNSLSEISNLLNASSAEVARINSATDVYQTLPVGREVVVPVPCPCSGKYYQHNSSYVVKANDTYLRIANETYESLTTCQALMAQNPYSSTNLQIHSSILVPLMCACPTRNQTQNGVKFLLTYPIVEGEDVAKLAAKFGVEEQSILDANEIAERTTIYPSTPLLIPFKREPTSWSQIVNPSQAPPQPPLPSTSPSPPPPAGEGHKKWVLVGVGIGLGFLLLAVVSCLLVVCFRRPRRRSGESHAPASPMAKGQKFNKSSVSYGDLSGKKLSTAIPENLLDAVRSLTVYKYEELQRATDGFSEDSLIKGSVYRAMINADQAAVKSMKGDVSNEIKALKQINHSNVIRLSGFCIHEGNTFLVYEFADNGSLSDWLHGHRHQDEQSLSKSTCSLSWKRRVQIACDVADGLNYLHNYTSPTHVHKNLKSSNILLDDKFRAKIANFGLAKAVGDEEDGLHLTRHVFGTHGYMAPEYLEHGLITSKLDVFAFGVVLLELLSGREAVDRAHDDQDKGELLLSSAIGPILEGDDAKEKLRRFMDPSLGRDYPLDLALIIARLASKCVADEMNSRPSMTDVLVALSASVGWTSSSASTYASAVI